MKTKIFFVLLSFIFSSVTLYAQEYKQEADLIKSIVGKAKKDFVMENLDIPEAQSELFWSYYNDYEANRQILGDDRVELLLQYANIFGSNDAKAYKSLIVDATKLQKLNEKNLLKYYKLINKHVGPKTASQFFIVEEYLRSTVESNLFNRLPLDR